jgi:hypothetical protein
MVALTAALLPRVLLRPLWRHLAAAHCRRLTMRRDQAPAQPKQQALLRQQLLLRRQLLLRYLQMRTPLVKLQRLLRS